MVAQALIPVRVTHKASEATGIASFDLVAANGAALPAFGAGAHIDVHLPGGLARQYSLCNAPTETGHYRIAVLHGAASRGGARAMHQAVTVGQVLQISPPRNLFGLAAGAQRHLLLAGGIGVTPMLAMAAQLAADGAEFALHYCTRSPDRTAFVGALQRSGFGPQVQHHFDDGDPAQRLDLPALLGTPQAGTHVYVCGPQGFMGAVLATARAAAWPEAQLHTESFGAAPAALTGACAFEVQLNRSGRVVPVLAGQTVVVALASAGVDIATSCGQGICGTCLTRVLAGEIDHRDQYLLADEQAAMDQFLPCCSRALSARLVLDL